MKRVDLYKFLGKWVLRSYPDDRGRPLMLGAGKATAPAALAPEALRAVLDSDCCELLRRPTMGLNLAAASVDCAALFAPILQEKLETVMPKIVAESFLDKVRFLNLARNVDRSLAETPEQCKSFLKKVRHMVRDHGDDLAAAAEAAAGLFLGLISILEVAAVSTDLRAWAKGVPERKKQSKHLQAWLQDPEDESKLFAAVAKSIKEDGKNETRVRRFGDLLAEPQEDSSSSPVVRSTSADSESGSSSPPRKSKKKRVTGKKAKKSKPQKKKKASKRRQQDSSSQSASAPAASRPSSQESEPAKKKRKHSPSVGGPKSKKTKKRSPTPSEDGSNEQPRTKCAAAASNLLSAWPLSQLQVFEEKAAQQATAAGAAGLEVEQRLALTKELPAEIRKLVWERAGLLPTTDEDEVLKANAERLLQHTVNMVKEVRLAWVQAAVQEDKKKGNVAVLSDDRLFRQLLTEKLPEDERAAWEAALKGDSPATLSARAELLRGLWSDRDVLSNYNQALSFVEKYATKEPKKEEAQRLVGLVPSHIAVAFGLPGTEKFKHQKPSNWKSYCSVAFSLAWQIFKAHVDLSVDA